MASAPVCTCGHLVINDRACACLNRCPTCASEDCCAETWGIHVRALTPSADLPACRDEDPAHAATLAACYPPDYQHPEDDHG